MLISKQSRVSTTAAWIGGTLWDCYATFFFVFIPLAALRSLDSRLQGGSSSHFSVQIARKLFHSHPVANEIGRCLTALRPAGTGTDHQPNLTTALQVPATKHKQTQLLRRLMERFEIIKGVIISRLTRSNVNATFICRYLTGGVCSLSCTMPHKQGFV